MQLDMQGATRTASSIRNTSSTTPGYLMGGLDVPHQAWKKASKLETAGLFCNNKAETPNNKSYDTVYLRKKSNNTVIRPR